MNSLTDFTGCGRLGHLRVLVVAAFCLCLAGVGQAQVGGTIKGTVLDEGTGGTLPGANVLIEGTTLGGAADLDGNFTISNVPPGNYKIRGTFIGYKHETKDVRVIANQEVTVDFELGIDALLTESVVVTGVASKTSKAVAPIAIQRINARELTEVAAYKSIHELLGGKVAGVDIQIGAGNLGTGTRLLMRSGGGINGNGQPVFYVDGIKVENSSWSGGQGDRGKGISSLLNLDPDDIENVEIIKGPAGASSYGTGGSNGVVLVTTRRGRLATPGGKNWSVTYRGDFGYNTLTVGEEAARNFELLNDELFRRGAIVKNSVSVTGGSDQMRMYLSVDRDGEDGHVPENRFEQTNVRANFDFFPSQKLTLRASTQFSDAEIEWPIHGGRQRSGGEWRYLIFNRFGYNDPRSRTTKPNFWATNKDLNFINSFTGSVTAEVSPWLGSGSRLEGLSGRVTIGMDNRDNRNIQTQEVTTLELHGVDEDGEKRIAQRNSRVLTYTGDLAYKYNLGPFSATSSVGAQIFNERARSIITEKILFANALLSDISVGEVAGEILEENDHSRSAGIFTSHDISYEDKYYATFMVRRDYASVLGNLTSAITYPAVKFMVRLDQFDWTPEFFSFLKLRTAYGETGVLPGRTDGIPLLWRAAESQFGIGGTISSIGNPGLKPERVKEFEIGFEAEVANYALDLTYYRQNTSDSIIPAENVPSSGLTSDQPKLNIGKIEGSGWETQLHANFAGRKFGGWRSNFTLTNSWQKNEVTDMGGANEIRQGPGGGRQYYREGLPKGAFYNPITLGAIFATEDNRISDLVDDPRRGTEVPVGTIIGFRESNGPVNLGTGDPDYFGSFASNVTVGGFTLYGNLSWKTGFFLYNEDRVDRISRGLRIPDGAYYTGDGGNVLDYDIMVQQLGIGDTGTGVATLTPGTQEYIDVANLLASTNRRNDANSIQPGDFLKLRELSFSYSFDKLLRKSSVFSNITSLRFGIVGSNLWATYKRTAYKDNVTQEDGSVVEHWVGGFTGADSEANSFGFTDGPQNSFNNGTIPQARSWSAFVKLTF